MVRADHSAGDWSAAGEGPLYLGEPVGFVIELEDGRRVYLRRRYGRFRRHGPDPRAASSPTSRSCPSAGTTRWARPERRARRSCSAFGRWCPSTYGTFPILAGTPDELRAELSKLGAGNVDVIAPERGVETPLP